MEAKWAGMHVKLTGPEFCKENQFLLDTQTVHAFPLPASFSPLAATSLCTPSEWVVEEGMDACLTSWQVLDQIW